MAEVKLPLRSEVPAAETWNAPSLFASAEAWHAEREAFTTEFPTLRAQFEGHLADGPGVLADYFAAVDTLFARVGKLYVYAGMNSAADTGDQNAAAMVGQAMGLYSQFGASVAFAEPEIIAIGQATINAWVAQDPRLEIYQQYFDDVFRKAAHVRSAEVEELLGMARQPFGTAARTAQLLANADIKFDPAVTSDGEQISVEQGNVRVHMTSPDRERRRTAYESYRGGYLKYKNAFANNLAAALQRDVFYARARRHEHSLAAALHPTNIPVEVFHNLIATYKANLPTWHKYWAIKRRILGVETLRFYDTWAPITDVQPVVPYAQGVDWIAAGMAPLGEDYVAALRRGCLEERWVDRAMNQGKRQGAFSTGFKGTFPFIMMSYDDSLFALSTLAHELGHSLHSYNTWQHQPMIYSGYSLFVAEVASNFNQALTRAYLLEQQKDDAQFQIALIDEAMYNFHRYFFQMPTLARFELEMHERAERGQPLNADGMIALMADLLTEGYGGEMEVNREYEGMMWAEFGHLYANFYVFQYATGISAAHELAQGILAGEDGAVDNYLAFLQAGSSLYPLDALKLAGVDMTTPAAVETTFGVLADYVDRLDELTS
ncbi:MAG: oligoendopeptidase F [Anaerolineae bacterium]|nr:oligoendopeptidase F [Anaerolineae bacterium]